jgi:uncharacterized protein YggU (UPF0235/DUF167 family)
MVDRDVHMHSGKMGSAITVQVTFGSAKTKISEVLDDGTIQISLAASKTGPQADKILIDFLARILGSEPRNIEIVAGLSGHEKLISILNIDAATVNDRIYQQMQ